MFIHFANQYCVVRKTFLILYIDYSMRVYTEMLVSKFIDNHVYRINENRRPHCSMLNYMLIARPCLKKKKKNQVEQFLRFT